MGEWADYWGPTVVPGATFAYEYRDLRGKLLSRGYFTDHETLPPPPPDVIATCRLRTVIGPEAWTDWPDFDTLAVAAFIQARLDDRDLFWETVRDAGQAHRDRVRHYRAETRMMRTLVEDAVEDLTKDVDHTEKSGIAARARGRLRDLAELWERHPDYREEWRP